MKQHGIGVGYRYPHDFEGADVDQRYLPDELADRRYYLPTDHGYEATIAQRMAGRSDTRATGRPRRDPNPKPTVAGGGDRCAPAKSSRKKLADTQKEDAGGG